MTTNTTTLDVTSIDRPAALRDAHALWTARTPTASRSRSRARSAWVRGLRGIAADLGRAAGTPTGRSPQLRRV
jgi:hypothetical protein